MISNLRYTEENYKIVKDLSVKAYNGYSPVKCNALGGVSVYFNAEGLNHIFYKNKRERDQKDQYMRLRVIDIARKIIDITTTTQEKDEKIQNFRVKINKKYTNATKIVKYWGFIAILERVKLRVVVRKVGEGNAHFWSVAPCWKTTKNGDMKFMDYAQKDLEED